MSNPKIPRKKQYFYKFLFHTLQANRTRIVQFTDLHLDLDYEIGAWANCTFPICCRKDNGFPPEGTTGANVGGLFGHVSCALPLNALEALYDHASNDEDEVGRLKVIYF